MTHLAEHTHELCQIMKTGKSGSKTPILTIHINLKGRLFLTKGIDLILKMINIANLQFVRLKIPLENIQIRQ